MDSILFVCLGNICRSPTAEAVIRAKAQAAGLTLEVDSAGTGNWHVGEPPYPPMIAAAARRGYDLSPLRARQVEAADFTRFDTVLVMDHANLRAAEAIRGGLRTRPELFLPFCHQGAERVTELPDPYYTRDFDQVLDLVEAAADALIARIRREAENPSGGQN